MKIYLDTCCYCRPYDDKTQRTVSDEADAVMTAIDVCQIIGHIIVGSTAVEFELSNIRDKEKRFDIETFFRNTIGKHFTVSSEEAAATITARAETLTAQGLGTMDAVHLATAEEAAADVLLTTDKDFLNISARVETPVKVMNPLNFLPEATK